VSQFDRRVTSVYRPEGDTWALAGQRLCAGGDAEKLL
jgi:hypothetical protein